MTMMEILQCVSCEGFGWFEDEDGQAQDCDWCGGIGYTYRDGGLDRRIPIADYEAVSSRLEQLETERLHEMGYTGEAKRPWEQKIRQNKGSNEV
jgi:hypothetical protein